MFYCGFQVTINEEFVANEQLNNCASGEQPAGTTAPQPSQPGSEAAALAAPAVVESDASSDGEHSGTAPGAAPAKNAKDNHQPAKDSRSQRPKQKRPRMAPPKEAVAAATPAGQRAMPKSSPEAPEAADAAGPPGQQGQAGQAFPHMEAVSRVLALPIVDSGVNIVSGVYSKVKVSVIDPSRPGSLLKNLTRRYCLVAECEPRGAVEPGHGGGCRALVPGTLAVSVGPLQWPARRRGLVAMQGSGHGGAQRAPHHSAAGTGM